MIVITLRIDMSGGYGCIMDKLKFRHMVTYDNICNIWIDIWEYIISMAIMGIHNNHRQYGTGPSA